MIAVLLSPVRQLVELMLGHESDRQIAAGAAIGAIVGLLPKDNLIAASLLFLLFSLRVNRSAGLMSLAVFAALSPLADGLMHRLGSRVLAIESMQPHYAWLYDQPLGPWIGFNNTVVVGALLVGLYIAYPVFAIVELACARLRPTIVKRLQRFRMVRWLFGSRIAGGLVGSAAGITGVMGDQQA